MTISDKLRETGELDDCGGMSYVVSISKDTPYAINIKAYAKTVRENSVKRQLIKAGTNITDNAFNSNGRESKELLENAEQALFEISEQSSKQTTGFSSIADFSKNAIIKIDELFTSKAAISGISTGFSDFDEMTSGLQKSDLIIVAGRPSMGKTAFALNIAESIAIEQNLPVAVFSMEMPGDSLAMRMMSSLKRINQTRIRNGDLSKEEWPRLIDAVTTLSTAKLFIDDTPALSPLECAQGHVG